MKQKKNMGFTLVELLVSIAVLSIVTLGVGGLLRLAAENYSNATKETEVQNLLQSTVASVSNALEDAGLGVRFDNSTKTLTIANKDNYIKFKLVGSNLYYDEGTYSGGDDDAKLNAAVAAGVHTNPENLLCDHVERFDVDASGADNGLVVLRVDVRYLERAKSLTQNVFLRNFQATDSYIQGLNGTPTPGGGGVTPSGAAVSPTVITPTTGGGGGGGGGHYASPTPEPTSTPVPTSVPDDYTARVSNVNPVGTNKVAFNMNDGSPNNTATFRIVKDGSNYKIENDGNEWIIGNIMPGYYNPGHNPLNAEQIQWLKDACGIDVASYFSGTPQPTTQPTTQPTPTDEPGSGGTFTLDNSNHNSGLLQNGSVDGNTMKFDVTWYSASMTVKIVKRQEGGKTVYRIEDANGSIPWMFQGRNENGYVYSGMPGYTYNAAAWDLTAEQVEWFKTAYGLDIAASFN